MDSSMEVAICSSVNTAICASLGALTTIATKGVLDALSITLLSGTYGAAARLGALAFGSFALGAGVEVLQFSQKVTWKTVVFGMVTFVPAVWLTSLPMITAVAMLALNLAISCLPLLFQEFDGGEGLLPATLTAKFINSVYNSEDNNYGRPITPSLNPIVNEENKKHFMLISDSKDGQKNALDVANTRLRQVQILLVNYHKNIIKFFPEPTSQNLDTNQIIEELKEKANNFSYAKTTDNKRALDTLYETLQEYSLLKKIIEMNNNQLTFAEAKQQVEIQQICPFFVQYNETVKNSICIQPLDYDDKPIMTMTLWDDQCKPFLTKLIEQVKERKNLLPKENNDVSNKYDIKIKELEYILIALGKSDIPHRKFLFLGMVQKALKTDEKKQLWRANVQTSLTGLWTN